MSKIEIAGRRIGAAHSPYIIAELSGNHNGDIGRAFALIEAAKVAGADAVKLQTYTADTITIDCDRPEFRIAGGLWDGRTLYELYQQASTPWEWHDALFAKARDLGIAIFSSPFDFTAVDFLEKLDAPAYKIASFEVIDLPLIERVAATGKPVIMSTGMATPAEIAEAVAAARGARCTDLVLLHCVSGYPTPPEEMNLAAIPALRETYNVDIGLSDHTLGTSVSIAAVALGAVVIEKHLTLRRADGGPDAEFSLEPEELARLVTESRVAHAALGRADTALTASETGMVQYRRSLYTVENIKAGEGFTNKNVRSIRPGLGLKPKHLPDVIGARAAADIARGTPLSWDLVAGHGSGSR